MRSTRATIAITVCLLGLLHAACMHAQNGDVAVVVNQNNPVSNLSREEVRKLEDEGKKLRQMQETLQGETRALEHNMALLTKLETFTAANTTNATEKGKMDSDATIALAKYVMENRSERTRELVNLQQQQENNTEKMRFAQRKLGELTAGTSKTERDSKHENRDSK